MASANLSFVLRFGPELLCPLLYPPLEGNEPISTRVGYDWHSADQSQQIPKQSSNTEAVYWDILLKWEATGVSLVYCRCYKRQTITLAKKHWIINRKTGVIYFSYKFYYRDSLGSGHWQRLKPHTTALHSAHSSQCQEYTYSTLFSLKTGFICLLLSDWEKLDAENVAHV